MVDLSKSFGKRLQEIRKMRKLTQSKLAELINVEVMTISRMESGTHFPKKENIVAIASVLNVDIKELFDFSNYDTKKNLILDIEQLLKQSTLNDIKFYKKMINCYLEAKSK